MKSDSVQPKTPNLYSHLCMKFSEIQSKRKINEKMVTN